MRFMKLAGSSAFAALFAVGLAHSGSAASLDPMPSATTTIAGNDNSSSNPAGFQMFLDFLDNNGFMSNTLTSLAKIEEDNGWSDAGLTTTGQGSTMGAWTYTGQPVSIVTYKSADKFTVALYDPSILSAEWSTLHLELTKVQGGNGPNAGQLVGQDISHIQLWDADTMTPVPLPAAAWMLLAGLAGIGVMARRKGA